MGERIRLTAMVKAAGCAAKLSPSMLDSVLAKLPKQTDPHVLIGFDTADDAGVYQLAPDLALVQTVDFFTPIVDDPYAFGQVAAANALSDVYAMGGRPISALSLVCFPNKPERLDLLEQILLGGQAKMTEAGCTIIGGHSIGDDEIKFGYAVTGLVNPQRVLTNAGARAGDHLILTKRIGTGIIGTAIKKGHASPAATSAAVDSMCTLNRAASEMALQFEVHAATDVTGFSLLGHAREMALASHASLLLHSGQIQFLPEAIAYSREGHLPGGTKRNRDFLTGCIDVAEGVPEEVRNLLYDPQTSGGLLLAVAPSAAMQLLAALRAKGIPAQDIGEVVEKAHPLIQVL
jgi:selenide, water dikinase